MAGKVLPAVVHSHESRAGASEGIALAFTSRGERQRERPLLRPEHATAAVVPDLRRIAGARAAQMRCEQYIGAQLLIAREHHLDQEGIALRTGHHSQRQFEALVPMHDADGGDARDDQLDRIWPMPLDLDPEPATVGD